MTGLIVVAVLALYVAGFMGMARLLAALDRRRGLRTDDGLNALLAVFWPGSMLVLLISSTALFLYDVAVKDAGIPRAERLARKRHERERYIAELERDTGVGPTPRKDHP